MAHLKTIIIGLSLLILGYAFTQASYWPPYVPDAIKIYDFRAHRLLAGGGKIDPTLWDNKRNAYPPFTSLVHLFVYQTGVANPQIVYPLFLTAFWLFCAGWVSRQTGSTLVGWGTGLAILATPTIMWNSFLAITNLVVMYYVCLAVLLLVEMPKPVSPKLGLLIGLVAGLVTFVRLEGVWAIPICLGLIQMIKARSLRFGAVLLAMFLVASTVWHVVEYGAVIAVTPTGQVAQTVHTVQTLIHPSETFIDWSNATTFIFTALVRSWGLTVVLYLPVLVGELLLFKKLRTIHLAIGLAVGILIVGAITVMTRYVQWPTLGDSLTRLAVVAIPLFWIAIFTSPMWFMQHRDQAAGANLHPPI